MRFKVVAHEAEGGGFWAEAPALPGCATQGETMDELMKSVREAIEGWLSVDIQEEAFPGSGKILEIAI